MIALTIVGSILIVILLLIFFGKVDAKVTCKEEFKYDIRICGIVLVLPPNPDFFKVLLDFIKNLWNYSKGHITVNFKRFFVTIASDDAAKTALLYAGAVDGCNILIHFLKELSPRTYRHIQNAEVTADFAKQKTECDIVVTIGIPLYRAIPVYFKLNKSLKNLDVPASNTNNAG